MPLSEHEQRLLDQIERTLYQEDPKFASTVRQTDLRTHMKRRMRRAGLVLALGFMIMISGLVISQPLVGVLGFVVMVGALLLAMTAWKRMGAGPNVQAVPSIGPDGRPGRPARPARQRKQRSSGSMMHRLEERWKRRWDERGGH